MHYRTNWLVVILLALGLHGAVFGGLILVRPLLDGSAEEVASEVGTTIELEDAPQSGEGEETKDPGYEDGAEGGSLVGEALPGKGLENIKAADISNEPAAETDIVKVMEERENPPPDTERWVSHRKSSWILIRRKGCIHLKALSVCLRRSEKMGR